jgi:glycosyltransferase involved in cell wall biosynthesis
MKILFIHQNFPGQFKHLAPALLAEGHDVRALAIQGRGLAGIPLVAYRPQRGNTAGIHPLANEFETKVIRGEAALMAMRQMDQSGWRPDVVVAHPGWGESLFVKDLWPGTRLLCFIEFHYGAEGRDMGFDPEFGAPDLAQRARVRVKNANNLLAFEAMDAGLSPTHWQKSQVPLPWQAPIEVVFDGIDTAVVRPDGQAHLQLNTTQGTVARRVTAGQPVLTYVARELEPYRGYHRFMRALPEIQARCPDAVTLIVGGDGVSYGAAPADGQTWKTRFLEEVKDRLDMSRIHFLGKLPYQQYLRVLQVSACHVYLTYPFVLSWSCIEALASGCLVVGSRTPPVQEVISHGENGLLVDFFDTEALVGQVTQALSEPQRFVQMRQAARERVIRDYDLHTVCLPAQLRLIDRLAARAPAQQNR